MSESSCPKCQRPYLRAGKFLDKHVAACDGTPYDPSKAKPKQAAVKPPDPPPSALDSTLQECRRAKDSLDREIVIVKAHLDRLQKEAVALDAVMGKIVEAKTA